MCIRDRPVLCGPGTGKPGADIVRFVGDQVALVVAEAEETAAAARDLIEVEFEDLPVVTDPITAMRTESPLIHPERGDSNVCVHYNCLLYTSSEPTRLGMISYAVFC